METDRKIERRKSPRARCSKHVKAFTRNTNKRLAVHDISCHGALLKTRTSFDAGETLNLALNLPQETVPIDIDARVVRKITICTAWGFCNFDIGVEFMNLIESQREKLASAVDYLRETMEKGV